MVTWGHGERHARGHEGRRDKREARRPALERGSAGMVNGCEAGATKVAWGNCWQAGMLRSRCIQIHDFGWRAEVGT